MNKIDTTQIVDPTSQQPFTGKSLTFLQDATFDALNALARGVVGGQNYSTSVVYALNGLTISASVIANGYVFYNGEVYFVVGANTTAYVNVPVLIAYNPIDAAYDPIMFSDGVNKNVHNIRYLQIADQLTGTGITDYSQLSFVVNRYETVLTPTGVSVATGHLKLVGSDFTGPNHKYNVKVRIEGDVRVPFVTDGKINWETNVTNETTAANYATDGSTVESVAIASGSRTIRYVATRYITGLAAGTALSIRQRNQAADAHVFEKIVLTYELY